MNILIPLDSKNLENSSISSIKNLKVWGFISLENGTIKDISTCEDYKNIDDLIDYLIIEDQNEDIEEFLDEGINILITTPFATDIESIIEAFIFKELYDYNDG